MQEVAALVMRWKKANSNETYGVDEAIAEYIAELVATNDVEDDGVVEMLRSFVPDMDERDAWLLVRSARRLHRKVSKKVEEKREPMLPTPVVRLSAGEELNELHDLMELAPQLSYECIESIFKDMFQGDKQRAAEYIATHLCTEIYTPLQVDADIRVKITDKYGDQVIEMPTSPSKKPVKIKLRPPPKKEGLIRYYESKVVTTKGVKYVEEKKPEYDGGSRGRVKTKGKRGRWVGG